MKAIYDFIGEPAFAHDFNNVDHKAEDFDCKIGAPGLHKVGKVVKAEARETIMPPDLFARLAPDSFWLDNARNTRGVTIV